MQVTYNRYVHPQVRPGVKGKVGLDVGVGEGDIVTHDGSCMISYPLVMQISWMQSIAIAVECVS